MAGPAQPPWRPERRDLLVAAGLALLVLAVHGQFLPQHVYGYDEADYRKAADSPLRDHWADRPSISLAEFLRSGRESLSGEASPLSRSELVRGSGDLPFLRHYHGPVYWYGLVPAARLAGDGEAALRAGGLIWAVLLAWILYAGCLAVGLGRLPAALAVSFVAFSPELIETFGTLTPHGAYVVVSTGALFLAAFALRSGSGPAWRAAAALVGLAAATGAFSTLLAPAILLSAAIAGGGGWPPRRAAWHAGLRRCLLAVGLLALLWPGAIVKLTLLRGWAFYGYLALARPATYGHPSAFEAWRARMAASPLEWALLLGLLGACAVVLWRSGPERSERLAARGWLLPFAAYGLLMGATTLFITTPKARYSASLMPVLFVLAATALAALLGGRRPALRAAVGLAVPCLLALNLFLHDRAEPLAPDPALRLDDRVVENLKTGSSATRLVLPSYYLPIAGRYVPGATLVGRDDRAGLLEATSRWEPDTVLYQGARDTELEAELIEARGAERAESLTLSGESLRITFLRFRVGEP